MPRYSTVIKSTWSVEDAFAFMSDFSNAPHWDPGVLSTRRIDTGAVREGSAFDLVVVFAGRKVRLRYAVRTIEAAQRVCRRIDEFARVGRYAEVLASR